MSKRVRIRVVPKKQIDPDRLAAVLISYARHLVEEKHRIEPTPAKPKEPRP
jgi:hypothetical protein